MLKEILDSAKLEPSFCASLLGIAPDQFGEWVSGVKPVPAFILPELSTILGVPESVLTERRKRKCTDESLLAPVIRFKLREERLHQADRETVGLIRKLGFYIANLQRVTGECPLAYRSHFREIRATVKVTAPPALQGRDGARIFRNLTGLSQGKEGIGEILRPCLRGAGVLIVESPLPKSEVEGCAFNVGSDENLTPCIYTNTFKSTWFRRNLILCHELAHAIFDLDSEQFMADFLGQDNKTLQELRASAFAVECMLPKSVLIHLQNQLGINWESLSEQQLASLVARSHVEQRVVLSAALAAELIDEEHYDTYDAMAIGDLLRKVSDRAVSTSEYLKQTAAASPLWVSQNRTANVGLRRLRLPAGYVQRVLEARNDGLISNRKAAEMMMMDFDIFDQRFPRSEQALDVA